MTVEVIAEVGSNWNGDFAVLAELAHAAYDAGADTVKVQHYPPAGYGPHTFLPAELERAQQIVEWHGLQFLASVFDLATLAQYRDVCHPTRVKIASPELVRDDLLEACAGLHVILSTGMSTSAQVKHAVGTLERSGDVITLLHCVSAYPAPADQVNLRALAWLETFGWDVGLSDHTIEPVVAPVAAVALGATMIEKHLTLDRRSIGPDHAYALEPGQFVQMVAAVRTCEAMLGDGVKRVTPSEDPTDRR